MPRWSADSRSIFVYVPAERPGKIHRIDLETGRREFWSLDFALSPETLVPRPDSETVIEAVLAQIGERGATLRLLDLGTGSGCLLLALLSELPAATGIGVDIAPEAALTARRNAPAQKCSISSCAPFCVSSPRLNRSITSR